MRQLLTFFTPENYQLHLTIDRTKETIAGKVQIMGTPHARTICLHAKTLDISSVSLIAPSVVSLGYSLDTATSELSIHLPPTLPLEQGITLELTWQTAMNRDMQACYLSTYQYQGHEERIATTQFESHYARECLPCIDEPAAKATFDLTLIIPDYQEGDIVLANTELSQKSNHPSPTFIFAPTPRMSTYLLAWTIGKFHSVSTTNQNGVVCTTYGTLCQPTSTLTFANDCAARALEYYDEKFDLKYPLAKLDQVALPDFEAGAMENWGLVTYRESMMLADTTATIATKQSVALTVTHELSHQWFGDLVTMAWWDDLWLNESFASIMEYYCTDALYPEFKIWQKFFTGDAVAALRRDSLPGVQAVHQDVSSPAEIATLFDGAIVYAKGARLILMLIRLLGEDNFTAGIRDYFKQFQYQNTIGDDLWQALQPYADFDVKVFMHAWISEPGFPVISHVELGPTAGDPETTNTEQRFLLSGAVPATTTWPLPTVFDDMSGHYLLNWSDTEFHNLLSAFDGLSNEQKIRLLLDRSLLAKTPAVSASSLLDLIPKFTSESSAAVWSIVADLITDLKLFCPPDTPAEAAYHQYLTDTLKDQFAQLDFGPLTDPDALKLRDIFLGLALYVKDPSVTTKLTTLYHPNLTEINSELRTAILIAKLRTAEAEVFDHFLAIYQDSHDPELKADLLYVLATQPTTPAHLDTMLGLLDQPTIVRPQDHLFLFIYLFRNHLLRDRVLDWLMTHWSYVEQLTGEKSLEDYPRYAANLIRTPAEAKKFHDFFDTKRDNPVLTRTLEIADTEISDRLALIKSDTPDVITRLAELTGLSIKVA